MEGLQNSTAAHSADAPSSSVYSVTSVVAFAVLAIGYFAFQARGKDDAEARFWKAHPMSGARREWFWWARVVLRSVFSSKSMVDNGYNTVCLVQGRNVRVEDRD